MIVFFSSYTVADLRVLLLFLFSCEKEITSPLEGYWTLVDVDYVYTSQPDIDTTSWFKTSYTYDGDSLYWVSETNLEGHRIQQFTMWYKLVMIINAKNEVAVDNNIVLKHYDK